MPRFSILVPVYNALPHLNDALASILNQTLSDYEVVLVDDGSTDGSAEVCDAFAAACDDAAVVHQENSGLLLARRVALGRASGDTSWRSMRMMSCGLMPWIGWDALLMTVHRIS